MTTRYVVCSLGGENASWSVSQSVSQPVSQPANRANLSLCLEEETELQPLSLFACFVRRNGSRTELCNLFPCCLFLLLCAQTPSRLSLFPIRQRLDFPPCLTIQIASHSVREPHCLCVHMCVPRRNRQRASIKKRE